MRNRSIAILALAAACVVPAGAHAGNPEDCASPIDMRSGAGLMYPSNPINCSTLQEGSLTYSPMLPGGSADILLTNLAAPVAGVRQTKTGSYLEYTSTSATGATSKVTVWLTWAPATNVTGAVLPGRWESQVISFSARDSATAGDVKVVVIDNVPDPVLGTPTTTYTRTFKTLSNWAD